MRKVVIVTGGALAGGETVVVPRTNISVDDGGGAALAVVDGASLQSLVAGLDQLGVSPRDLITILQALKSAGALQAENRGAVMDPVAGRAFARAGSRPPSKAEATAREFEAVFLGQMTKLMMESVEVGDEFSGGHGEEMFRGVLAENLGKEIAKRGGVGLAPAVLEQMIRMQGGTGNGR